MDKQLVNSVYDAIKDDPKVASLNERDVKNTLEAISMRMLLDTHKVDTFTILAIYCTMIGINKNKYKPTKCYIRTKPY